MLCPRCQHDNALQAKFCQECGIALPRACGKCNSALPTGAKFCPECGHPVVAAREPGTHTKPPAPADNHSREVPPGDRRQATVLFVDISGYTALCARTDAEEVQALLGRFYEGMDRIVAGYGGQVFDHAGDGLMAVFGAPVAHGNDAERAVRAAIDMHMRASTLADGSGDPLRLHIGLAAGEVVAAVILGGAKPKYSVTGETVNMAARLDALAAPGETLITESLCRAVAQVVDAEPLGEHAVKGLDRPVPVWRIRSLRPKRAEPLPFVGRHTELRQLSGVIDSVLDTRAGIAVFVRGEAGIGKSRLVDECRALAAGKGYACHTGQVLDFGVARGQDAVPTILKDVLQVASGSDRAAMHSALVGAMQSGLVESSEEIFLNELLDLDQEPEQQAAFDAMDSAIRVQRTSDTLAAVLGRAAARQPRVLIVEDLHWASPALLRHLAALTLAVQCGPMILVMTSRVEGDPLDGLWRAATRGRPLLTIDLAPLRDDEARLLAGVLIETSSRFALQCIERAEGNPLFLEQLLHAARYSDQGELPPTIQSLVLARIDRLSRSDKLALQAASVIGKRFTLEALRQIVDNPGYDCDALIAVDLVRSGRGEYGFAHALIQEGVYASILKAKRRELHRIAADLLGEGEAILRAEHLERAEDPRAAQAYLAAATQEAARLRHDAALRLSERGLELAASPAVHCGLAMLRADLLREVGLSQESIQAFRAVLDSASVDAERCRAWMGIAAGNRITGDFAQAMVALDEAQSIAEPLGLNLECSRIHHMRGNLHFAQGSVADCQEQHGMALEYAQRSGNDECEAQALSGLGDAQYAQGRMLTALEYFRRCVELCERHGWMRVEIPNRCMVGHCLWYNNQLGRSVIEAHSAAEAARKLGLVQAEIFAQESLGLFLPAAGRDAEAEEACRRCLFLAEPAGARRFASTVRYALAMIRLRAGNRVAAKEELAQALDLARQTGMGFLGPAVFGGFARVAERAEERRSALQEGEALLRGQCVSHCHLWFYHDAIEATLCAADWDEALRYAAALENYVRAEPLPWARLIAERARALADIGISGPSETRFAKLSQLRNEAASAELGSALPAMDAVLRSA